MSQQSSTTGAGCLQVVILCIVIDVLQYLCIGARNLVYTIIASFLPNNPILLILPRNTYDIHIAHVGVTFGVFIVFTLFGTQIESFITSLIKRQTNTTPRTRITFSNQQPKQQWIHIQQSKVSTLLEGSSTTLIAGVAIGLYTIVLSFMPLNQFVFNGLFTAGFLILLVYLNVVETK